MPDTPLQFIGTGLPFHLVGNGATRSSCGWSIDAWSVNGISRFVVLDPMHDLDAMLATARMIREEGGEEIIAALTYTRQRRPR